ncbi:hypothetical protein VYU27_001097 [Nannochloropsis oceanica]
MATTIIFSSMPPLLAYYTCAAVTIYVVLGRFSSPNPRLRWLKLKDLEKIETEKNAAHLPESDLVSLLSGNLSSSKPNVVAGMLQSSLASSSSPSTSPERKAPVMRKLSFLATTGVVENPFMNNTWEIYRLERLKCAVFGPVLIPPRLLLLIVSLLGAYGFGKLSTIGAELERPMPRWRINLQHPMKFFARGIMFALGYHWISIKGKQASPQHAPIVVSNHCSFCEAIYLPGRLLSMAVSRRENAAIPFFGGLMQQVQCIFVSRTDKDSRTTVADEILRRSKVERGLWHRQLLVFPEGTTTNGSAVISFKVGSFAGGVSVQPVAVSYPSNKICDPSWVSGGPHPGEILFKLLCQPWNCMNVTFLPVYNPDAAEIADPLLFSTNVRRLIAAELGVPASDHSFDDVLLLMEAKKLGYQGGLRDCISELKNMRKILEIDLAKAKEYLHDFSQLDTYRKGLLSYPQFIKAFGSKDSDALRSLFCVLDVQDRGVINLVEYTTGLALLNEQGTDGFDGAMRLIFKIQDSSGEGRLSKEDTAKVLRRLWPDVTTELLDSTFAAADTDKDGTLSADEFLALARSNQHLWPSLKSSLCGKL